MRPMSRGKPCKRSSRSERRGSRAHNALQQTFFVCVMTGLAGNIVAVMEVAELRAKIRDIKDFPTEGILFRDITTLLKDSAAWESVIDHLSSMYQHSGVDVVVGVES